MYIFSERKQGGQKAVDGVCVREVEMRKLSFLLSASSASVNLWAAGLVVNILCEL